MATTTIGILTSGGDCPGLNAAIRAITKAAIQDFGMKVLGIFDGFRGLVENRFVVLEDKDVSGILTEGGTILGTSRDKPHKMKIGNKKIDMTEKAIENVHKNHIDYLICIGGGGTQKNAFHLSSKGGIKVITLPKTIDNDVAETDQTIGFSTALSIATEAIDRLHSTASSHQRIMICETMGHNAGWLALGAGLAGGADVILIPEIPYSIEAIALHIKNRQNRSKKFSIIALAEGAHDKEEKSDIKEQSSNEDLHSDFQKSSVLRLSKKLEELTKMEVRLTSLGHILRGGTPSAEDRILATRLGIKAVELINEGVYNVMISVKGNSLVPVALSKVAGEKKLVPLNHDWIISARRCGTCFGEQ